MLNKAKFMILLLPLASTACTNVGPPATPNPTAQGITVLCDAGTGQGVTASIVVSNLQTGKSIPAIINPNTKTATVCSTVNSTAIAAGLSTNYSAQNATGLEIYGPPATIQIKCKEITLELQTFQPLPQGAGPRTDCPQ